MFMHGTEGSVSSKFLSGRWSRVHGAELNADFLSDHLLRCRQLFEVMGMHEQVHACSALPLWGSILLRWADALGFVGW